MKQRSLRLAVWKYRDTAHDRLYRVSINDTLLDARDEEGRLTTLELVVQVDEEGEERGLARIGWRRIVFVSIGDGIDT